MPHQLDKVLERLEALTCDRQAKWKESGRAAELVLPLSGAVVMLSKNPYTELFGGVPAGPFKLSLLSESGSELASLEARSGEPLYSRLKNLYENAQAQATRVNQRIGEIEQQLAQL